MRFRFAVTAVLIGIFACTAFAQVEVEIRTPDVIVLRGTYFSARKPGPGVLLFHQSNRTRHSWDDVAKRLAAAGINTLTVDSRAHGDSGGKFDAWTDPDRTHARASLSADLDAAFRFLSSQTGVMRDRIGLGGAGLLGVDNAVRTARQHSADVKSASPKPRLLSRGMTS